MIYILRGDIRTGKTTALLELCKNRDDVDGVLCPDNGQGKRYFLEIKSKNEFELETEFETEAVIEIGNFKFLQSGFEKANSYLLCSTLKSKHIIIDELGKLELKNEGLHVAAVKLISNYKSDKKQHLILVVRDYLLDAVLKHYAISDYKILNKEDLKNL